jgi:hypothetical protein
MPYRIKPGVPLVIAKDRDGKLHHYYNQPIGGSILYGSCIPWLNAEQRDHFLRIGLVEEIEEELEARTSECVEAMRRLGLPLDTGAPTASSPRP